jgi:hypothetical protein
VCLYHHNIPWPPHGESACVFFLVKRVNVGTNRGGDGSVVGR